MAELIRSPADLEKEAAFAKKYGIKPAAPVAPLPPKAVSGAPVTGVDAIRQGLQVEALKRREGAAGL